MKWVKDTTGRFPQRPHYERSELDQECESIITTFLQVRYGEAKFPVDSNDLTILLEQEVDDLDLYADLTQDGQDVEGITEFFRGSKPNVRIARELSEQDHRKNRFRTTVTHEFGHVKFHNFLAGLEQTLPMPGFGGEGRIHLQRCKRETVLGAKQSDWMEWQAGYVSGAILMPATQLRGLVQQVLEETNLFSPISLKSMAAEKLICQVKLGFQVSADAARVRLLQTGHLVEHLVPGALFAPNYA